MDRTRALLAAGGLTGLVLATLLALGLAPDGQAAAIGSSLPSTVFTTTLKGTTAGSPEVSMDDSDTLLEQNRQLKQALELMQIREGQYREQIERANQALQQTRSPEDANFSDGRRYDDDEGEHDDKDRGGSHDRYEDEHEREHEYEYDD